MANPQGYTENFRRHLYKQQLAKAKRLTAGKPKWKDEQYMTPEEYEAYIDGFLQDGEKDAEKVKIAVQMYDKKMKYDPTESADETEITDLIEHGVKLAEQIREDRTHTEE